MPKLLTPLQANAIFAQVGTLEPITHQAFAPLLKAIRYAPHDADPVLWARASLRLFLHSFQFDKECHRLSAATIRSFFEQLPPSVEAQAVFLRAAVDLELTDRALEDAWTTAMQCQVALQVTHAIGAASRRSKVPGIAKNPRLLGAIQASVASLPYASEGQLVVLVHDGSEASVDALLPVFERAVADENSAELDRLLTLRAPAKRTAALDAMFAKVDSLISARSASSPGLHFAAQSLGLEGLEAIYFGATVRSSQLTSGNVPRVLCTLRVDSRKKPWFTFSGQGFDDSIESVEPAGWPAWLRAFAKRKRISWSRRGLYVTGKHRARITEWLDL